jgi:ubiquinone/menaquinone biosynthesis C-methylase UbiE
LILNMGQHTETAPDLEGLRAGLHSMWEMVAPQWTRNAAHIEQRTADLTASMLDAVAISNGERVLELACGPGALGLAVAKRFPESEVILSDIAAGMTAVAALEAEERGLTNVRVAELDLERIDQSEESFDVVLCREGIMLVPEPGRAAGEIRRVLRPGGRTAVSVWGSPEQNPWLTALTRALSVQLEGTFPPPGMPGPLALGNPEKLRSALADGGLEEIEIWEVEVPWRGASLDEWWDRTTALAGPVAKLLAVQSPEVVDAIRSTARGLLSRYETADGLEIPGMSLVAVAARD